MTRRLTLTIIGVVAGALVLVGLVTLGLARLGARQAAEDDLREEVEGLAAAIETLEAPAAITRLRNALDLDGLEIIEVRRLRVLGELPEGVTADDLDREALQAGETVSGSHGSLVYAAAAAPAGRRGVAAVVVATRDAGAGLGPAARWFLVAAAGTVVAAAFVARGLSSRLTEPIRATEEAARRIAGGDLAARVPVGGADGADERDELADLARSVNDMAGALERARDLERQFLLSVSHDLRTPLTSIRGYAEAVADGTEDDAARAAGVILAEARRLERLVADLLELAKLEARGFSLHLAPVDVGSLAADAAESFGPAAAAAGVRIEVDRPAETVVASADRDRLAQVVANLLENALRYAAERIVVGVTAVHGFAVLTVDDDGPGLADRDAARAFDRLYAPERARARPGPGSGLGLAIVHELVTGMGGEVTAGRSRIGGARFEVRLPRHDPHGRHSAGDR